MLKHLTGLARLEVTDWVALARVIQCRRWSCFRLGLVVSARNALQLHASNVLVAHQRLIFDG